MGVAVVARAENGPEVFTSTMMTRDLTVSRPARSGVRMTRHSVSSQQIHDDLTATLQLHVVGEEAVATVFDGCGEMDSIGRLESVLRSQLSGTVTHGTCQK